MSAIDAFLSRLQKVRKTGSESWLACCPAHGDKHPSMSVAVGNDGRVLVHCFSQQCGIDEIAGAVGMTVSDLMPENAGYQRAKPLRCSVNPRDAMFAMRADLTQAFLYAKQVQRGEVLSDEDSLSLARIVGRVQMAIELTGGE